MGGYLGCTVKREVKFADNLRIIRINNLTPIKQQEDYRQSDSIGESLLPVLLDQSGVKILAHYKNIDCNTYGNSLFSAFMEAYNNHEDITLVPDDVWMTILFQFSKCVNNNSEEMRKMFVSFEGKQTLTVVTANELSEGDWKEFFDPWLNKLN